VQLLPSASVSAEDLKAYSAQLLTSYKRPTELIVLDALPSASTGKILKHKLRELAIDRASAKALNAAAAG
jgi:acyl-CoA synthetase (AMP-forming)/AMP-acid ligase II